MAMINTLVAFYLLFCLLMDYEVLLLSRISSTCASGTTPKRSR